MRKFLDLAGQRFEKLVALGIDEQRVRKNKKSQYWKCQCDCGRTTSVATSKLTHGEIKSCGCMRGNKSHNMSDTRPHNIWMGMRSRCNNPNTKNYKYYVGKGITYCERWETFEGFWEDMQEGYADHLTIDRIDSNGNYEKSNCRWATAGEQSRNRRNCIHLFFNGETKTVAELCDELGFNKKVLYARLKSGWSVEKALTTPTQKCNRLIKYA